MILNVLRAREQRDAVRSLAMQYLRSLENPSEYVRALLAADDLSTAALTDALTQHEQEQHT